MPKKAKPLRRTGKKGVREGGGREMRGKFLIINSRDEEKG